MPESISLLSAFTLGAVASAAMTWVMFEFVSKPRQRNTSTVETSHFDPAMERRGIGTLIKRLNHVALAVSDVGRSLQFYTGDDLKVSHISFESDDIAAILQKLSDLGIVFKKSVSVPDPAKSRANKIEADPHTAPTSVIQYFLRDPDGYYIEICNCEVLTDFCFRKGEEAPPALHGYAEGVTLTAMLGAIHWRHAAHDPATAAARLAAYDRDVAERADEAKLANLLARRLTYGDICQGFSEDELRDVLRRAGNDVRVAVAQLTAIRGADRVLIPPTHLEGPDTPYQPQEIHIRVK